MHIQYLEWSDDQVLGESLYVAHDTTSVLIKFHLFQESVEFQVALAMGQDYVDLSAEGKKGHNWADDWDPINKENENTLQVDQEIQNDPWVMNIDAYHLMSRLSNSRTPSLFWWKDFDVNHVR